MGIRHCGSGNFEGATNSQWPYPYGTDLHWFWGWGQRIGDFFDSDPFVASDADWIVIRADEHAANAMLRYSVDYAPLVEEVKHIQREVENRWDEVLNNETEATLCAYAEALDVLNRRIFKACELIAEREKPKPDDSRKKKIQPKGKTVDIIRAIQAGKENDEVVADTGSSIGNVRTVRRRLNQGKYEI